MLNIKFDNKSKTVLIICLFLFLIISVLYVYLKSLGILGNDNLKIDLKKYKKVSVPEEIVDQEVKKHPKELEEKIKESLKEFEILRQYALINDIEIPESVQKLAREDNRYEALDILRNVVYEEKVAWKNVDVIRININSENKQDVYKELSKVAIRLESGFAYEDIIEDLRSMFSEQRIEVINIPQFDCSTERVIGGEKVLMVIDDTKIKKVSSPIDLGESYVIVYVKDGNVSEFCSYEVLYEKIINEI